MGSAEFEIGDREDSMKRIIANDITSQDFELELNERPFKIYFVAGKGFQFETYFNEFFPFWTKGSRLKENSFLEENIKRSLGIETGWLQKTDVWFDIENDVFFCISQEMNDRLIAKLQEIKTKWSSK
jgi:hypothetical protein